MQYFVEANSIALRHVSKEDKRRIAEATGSTQVQPVILILYLHLEFS